MFSLAKMLLFENAVILKNSFYYYCSLCLLRRLMEENRKHQEMIVEICAEKNNLKDELKKRSETEKQHINTIKLVSHIWKLNANIVKQNWFWMVHMVRYGTYHCKFGCIFKSIFKILIHLHKLDLDGASPAELLNDWMLLLYCSNTLLFHFVFILPKV